jgi:hypothetical protein
MICHSSEVASNLDHLVVKTALWQNLWARMAHPKGRQASPLRVATGGDASWRLEARRHRSPACPWGVGTGSFNAAHWLK